MFFIPFETVIIFEAVCDLAYCGAEKIAAAEEMLALARLAGFQNAALKFVDDEGDWYQTLKEISEAYDTEKPGVVGLILVLDKKLALVKPSEDVITQGRN